MEKYIEPSLLKFKNRAQVVMENHGLEPKRTELLKLWWDIGWVNLPRLVSSNSTAVSVRSNQ